MSEPLEVIDPTGPFTAARGRPSADAPADDERVSVPLEGDDTPSLAHTVEALLFLSTEPLSAEELADATQAGEEEIRTVLELLAEQYAPGRRESGCASWAAVGRSPRTPPARTRHAACSAGRAPPR